MKNNDKSNHQELMDDLTRARRELMEVEVSNRNIPNLINRGKALAAIVTAQHREEIMEAKRQAALWGLDAPNAYGKLKPKQPRRLKGGE